ncbi:MAG: universal stress protein, partial [Pricia sp.]|nr:universal stress protein [Pricia sp.]
MKTILIPTDFSQNAWNALEYAVKLFQDVPCTFYILHIGDLKDSSVKGNSFIMPAKKIDDLITKKLSDLFERIRKLHINKRHHFIAVQDYGNILNTIRKQVDDKNIDLIVMGTKGASGLKKAIIGSNTGDVITKVACNVLVVPDRAVIVPPRDVAFPTDYNIFYSYPILEAISEIFTLSQANLRVLNIAPRSCHLTKEQQKNKAYLQDYL